MMQFDLPKEENSIIKVFGVGGGGSNAVNHMFRQGITGVDFYVCNTDQQALDASPIPNKIQLGMSLTEGRGAGSISEVGKNAALENLEEIKAILSNNTKMVFITAGMGGGTGTGAAPIIAKTAKDMGILTVGIVTYPFLFEGKKRSKQAQDGLEQLRSSVDTLLIICNDKLREIYGNLTLKNAFAKADDILTTAAKGIAEIITVTGYINVDFEDVKTVMTNSGVAIMGSASAEGENRAISAVQEALSSPLLNDNNIEGANYILLNITSGQDEVLMDEITEITDYIQDEAGLTADIIWGSGYDESLGDKICVTLIATGFSNKKEVAGKEIRNTETQKRVFDLNTDFSTPTTTETLTPTPVQQTIEEPVLFEQKEEVTEELPLGWELKTTEEPVEEKEKTNVVRYSLYENEPETNNELEIINEVFSEENTEEDLTFGLYTKEQSETVEQKTFTFESPKTPVNTPSESAFTKELNDEENLRRSQERIAQLKLMSTKMKSPSGIADLENQPAYLRRNIRLDEVAPSSQINASRYTLSQDDENKTEIRNNNSFLHDNVD